MENDLPPDVQACLWSYDTERIDLSNPDHRRRVIENVLNYGTKTAVDWLFTHVTRNEITEAIAQSAASTWDKKSLALWSQVFSVMPSRAERFSA